MPNFHYQARDKQGEFREGQIDAVNADAAATKLINRGFTPIHVAKTTSPIDVADWIIRPLGRIRSKHLILFSRQMHTLIQAGVPIVDALRQLAMTTYHPSLKKILRHVADQITAGQPLSNAMKQYPNIFSAFVINTIRVGENSGHIDQSFQYVTDYYKLQSHTAQEIKNALRYPAIVLTAIFAALLIVNTVMIPAFARLFESFQAELPLATRILMGTSKFITHNWINIIASTVGLIIIIGVYVTSSQGRYLWHGLKLKLPIVGSIIKRILLARFARSFALTLRGGAPLIDGIELASASVGNDYLYRHIRQMKDYISRGYTLTNAAAATKQFPPMVLQMLSVGEQSGEVDAMLQQVAEFYEGEIEYELKRLADVIQPLVVIFIAGMVFILALGVYLPMWQISNLLNA